MRLIKLNDVILNVDRIAVIKGSRCGEDYGGGFIVRAYVNSSNYVELGRCETQEDYENFMSMLYMQFQWSFEDEVAPIQAKETEKELWV